MEENGEREEWTSESEPERGSQIYEVDQAKVNLFWRKFQSDKSFWKGKEKNPHPDSAIIFLPGWSSENVNSWSSEPFCGALSRYSKNMPVYAVDTKSEPQPALNIHQEAEAITHFIEEKGLKDVTITGHSEGADQAIDVAVLLEKNAKVLVNGLVLICPVGIYEQRPTELIRKFVQNAMKTSDNQVNERGWQKDTLLDALVFTIQKLSGVDRPHPLLLPKGMVSGVDLIFGLLNSIKFNWKYLINKFPEEVKTMAKANSNLKEVKAPIVLIQGASDPVSDYRKIISQEDRDKMKQEKDDLGEFLKRTFFQKSVGVKLVIGEGDHSLPLSRYDAVARAGIGLIERFKRKTVAEFNS